MFSLPSTTALDFASSSFVQTMVLVHWAIADPSHSAATRHLPTEDQCRRVRSSLCSSNGRKPRPARLTFTSCRNSSMSKCRNCTSVLFGNTSSWPSSGRKMRALDFKRNQRSQLCLTTSLRRTRTAMSSACLATAARVHYSWTVPTDFICCNGAKVVSMDSQLILFPGVLHPVEGFMVQCCGYSLFRRKWR